MHFWIDKRSQQCGFGRSRVAASLSGSGGAGMGLGFGHPPRRMGGSKSSTTRSALPDCHHSNTSRSHQHHHQQPHASNNNNFGNNGNNCQHAHTNANMSSNIGSGNAAAAASAATAATATTTTTIITTANAIQSNLNNNSHQYAYQQHSSHSNHPANNSNTNTINTINQYNNNASAALVTAVGNIAPATHSYNQRAATVTTTTAAAAAQYPPSNHHYDLRSYHHPQFGNMSLRHYQHPSRNCGPSHTNAAAILPHNACGGSSTGGIIAGTGSGMAGGAAAGGGNTYAIPNVQHVDQPSCRQPPQTVHHSAYSHMPTNDSTCIMAAPAQANASYAVASTAQRYNAGGSTRTSHMTESAHDVQLLPSHLKCGMCASLMLASVFVAGAKFYFDHQGTGLEVLIFCAFSTTFFLAACTVSLCRVPKGLLPGVRSAGVLDEHQHGRGGAVHCAVSGGGPARAGAVGSGAMGDSHPTPLYGQQAQLIEESLAAAAAAAGPPPYHIAIFFPETESSSKAKEASLDDESPPPSYDKILI